MAAARKPLDRIRTLTSIQSRQDINVGVFKDADVIAAVQDRGATCVQIFFFRAGQNYGNRSYFPRHAEGEPVEEVLSAFIGQFYANKMMPKEIVISHAIAEKALIERALFRLTFLARR